MAVGACAHSQRFAACAGGLGAADTPRPCGGAGMLLLCVLIAEGPCPGPIASAQSGEPAYYVQVDTCLNCRSCQSLDTHTRVEIIQHASDAYVRAACEQKK